MQVIKIGYFADGPWGHRTFEKILSDKDYEIKFVCVRYSSNDLKFENYCKKYNIAYLKHKNINSVEFLNQIKDYNCDLFVSMSFNQIFKSEIIKIPPLKIINCHAGKLPFYRGRNIINWALINDEIEFGITVHFIDEGIDTGDIILQRTFPITDSDTYSTLLEKAYIECPDILFESIKKIKEKNVKKIKQNSIHPIGFYCPKRKKGDERINWNQSSRDLFNFIRAISLPGPQARSFIENEEIYIEKAEYIKVAPKYIGIPGAVLFSSDEELIVKTKDTFIRITKWSSNVKIKAGSRLK